MTIKEAFPLYLIVTMLALLLSIPASASTTKKGLTLLKAKPIAPNFILQDIYGRQHALSDYKGKVVVVNFWATWCPPCRKEMPSMQRAADWLAQYDIALIAIGVGETKRGIMQFLQITPLTFPLLLDTKSKVMEAWSARSLPTTFVLDQAGNVVYLAVGEREWDDPKILKQIRSLKQP